MTSQYATSRKLVLHVNGSPTRSQDYFWPYFFLFVNLFSKFLVTFKDIFINNASIWKSLQATLLFYLMYVCVFIYRNDSLL